MRARSRLFRRAFARLCARLRLCAYALAIAQLRVFVRVWARNRARGSAPDCARAPSRALAKTRDLQGFYEEAIKQLYLVSAIYNQSSTGERHLQSELYW